MPTTTATSENPPMRELDHRRSCGIDVTLLWEQGSERLVVAVSDTSSGDYFVISAEPSEATGAFRHPYAFAARHRDRVSGRSAGQNATSAISAAGRP